LIDRSQHCPIELEVLEDHHWWMADEIIDAAGEVFTPRRLGYFFKQLLEDGPPATPIDVGI
jgi:hypothetical protein